MGIIMIKKVRQSAKDVLILDGRQLGKISNSFSRKYVL